MTPLATLHPVRAALEAGQLDDATFDRLYGGRTLEVSPHFWTPVAVGARVAALLTQLGASRVLDVGSGAGKFCLTAAAIAPKLKLVGIEQRADLVTTARYAATQLALENVSFVHGNVTEASWSVFDAFYFFNSFGENLHVSDAERVDNAVELSGRRYMAEVAWTEHRLASLPVGSIVVTYHGFGGGIPASYELIGEEPAGSGRLRVWLKTAPWRTGCWYELLGEGVRRGRMFTFDAGA